jgi:hypothetical protein
MSIMRYKSAMRILSIETSCDPVKRKRHGARNSIDGVRIVFFTII